MRRPLWERPDIQEKKHGAGPVVLLVFVFTGFFCGSNVVRPRGFVAN